MAADSGPSSSIGHSGKQPVVPHPEFRGGRPWPAGSPEEKRGRGTERTERGSGRRTREGGNILLVILLTIGVLVVLSVVIAAGISLVYSGGGGVGGGSAKVALIPVEGMILSESGSAGLFSFSLASSDRLIDYIKRAEKDSSISAIVLRINSQGGSPVPSEEVAKAVKEAEKPTVAIIRDTGTSGAYWIASAADHIVANRMSITGSIGVYGSYLEFAGLMDIYNVSYQRLVAGEHKDLGTPYREMTPEEKALLQSKLDRMHEYFIKEVAANRGMSEEAVSELATGMFYLGEEAYELGLVDELGGEDEASQYLKGVLEVENIRYVEYREAPSFLESLGTMLMGFLPSMSQTQGEILLT